MAHVDDVRQDMVWARPLLSDRAHTAAHVDDVREDMVWARPLLGDRTHTAPNIYPQIVR